MLNCTQKHSTFNLRILLYRIYWKRMRFKALRHDAIGLQFVRTKMIRPSSIFEKCARLYASNV